MSSDKLLIHLAPEQGYNNVLVIGVFYLKLTDVGFIHL